MKISVLGGGSEVGASCLHIEMANTNLLIDAGMRMHGDDPLPALGMLDDRKQPEAILVTHAHADHIGALPVVHSLFPDVPIYATPPTVDLMRIMMKDSFKILEQRCMELNTLPPYTEAQVHSLLESVLHFPARNELKIGNLKITSYRAGHILGAVMFLIEGEGEQLFVTGDLSFKAGRTIPGAKVPNQIRPDVVIMESTYGNRAHTDRSTEESRLAKHVAEVVSGGGFALIPAFALGRAQEVLLVLQDYMDKGLIPEFPIYVDGLVTPISRIYKNYPHFLKGNVSHRIRNHGDVFLTEGRCKAVTPKERENVLNGKKGCVVASSGMLTGGASTWYAEKLVSDKKNAIFITGYQDEESPGKKLLNVANGVEEHLELNGTSYPVKCRIGKYGLSAHADAEEMNRFIQTLQPTYTLLVHGDDEARTQLANHLDSQFHPILVENGEFYPFEKRSSGKGVIGKRPRWNNNPALTEKIGSLLLYQSEKEAEYKVALCTGVNQKSKLLFCQTLKGKQMKLQEDQVIESIDKWNQSINELKEAAERVLTFSRPYLKQINWSRLPNEPVSFQSIIHYLQLTSIETKIAAALALQSIPGKKMIQAGTVFYSLNHEIKQQLNHLHLPIQALEVNPARAMDTARELLGNHQRFMRCGVDDLGSEKQRLTIYFDFPDAVFEEERREISETLKERTGWNIAFSDSVRQDRLQGILASLLGQSAGPLSIHLNERTVSVPISRPEKIEEKLKQFKKETGFDVTFKDAISEKGSSRDKYFQAHTPSKKLENNLAIEEAKQWANDRGITIYKTSIKQNQDTTFMEVHFISPEKAMQHESDLEELSYRIGMPVTYAKNPKQNELIRLTLETIPSEWELKKTPSIHIDRASIAVKTSEISSNEEKEILSKTIKELTGYHLEIVVS